MMAKQTLLHDPERSLIVPTQIPLRNSLDTVLLQWSSPYALHLAVLDSTFMKLELRKIKLPIAESL